MKVCDVVLNSIWYDPRVRKQLTEYKAQGIEVCAVGMRCNRYDAEKLSMIPCRANIVQIDPAFDGQQRGVFRKLKREKLRHQAVRDAIIAEKPDVIHAFRRSFRCAARSSTLRRRGSTACSPTRKSRQ